MVTVAALPLASQWGGDRAAAAARSPSSPSPSPSFSSSSSKRSRSVRRLPSLPRPPLAPQPPVTGKNRKRAASTRLWMRLDRRGGCEILMCDKAFVSRRSGVPARDLRVLGPLLSRSPSILGELMM